MTHQELSEEDEYRRRGLEELRNAPDAFQAGLSAISEGDIGRASRVFAEFADLPETAASEVVDNRVWRANALACLAYCAAEQGMYEDAATLARASNELGFSLTGGYYFHDAYVKALNRLDRLPEALSAADDAVRYFREEGSISNVADHLFRKANILKQMAALFSRSDREDEAKLRIMEAIRALCKSAEYIGAVDDDEWRGELEVMVRIASRTGATVQDFSFLDSMPSVRPLVERQLGANFARIATAELRNIALEMIRAGRRDRAAQYLERANAVAPEETQEDRAFKALLICYQYGVCLLKMYALEHFQPSETPDSTKWGAVKRIQEMWNETLRLYRTLSPEYVRDFDGRWPPGLAEAARAIRRDRIMLLRLP